MLHELLLALSGHPSSLLYPTSTNKLGDGDLQDLLSPAETTLLKTVARNLGEKHRRIRERATRISSTHSSIICRAVSTAIISTHLANFQQKILNVEREILEENPSLVGAYQIVPLSGLVGAFGGWDRKLEWLWNLVQFIEPDLPGCETWQGGVSQPRCTADKILEWLRDFTHTGYPDIERIALNLTKIAESAWLKQISAWVLYGRLPLGAADFFITEQKRNGKTDVPTDLYSIKPSLVPAFVTPSTANSILFIGKSLNHIRDKRFIVTDLSRTRISPELELLPPHLARLSSLGSPISSSSLSAAISAIRFSLSKNALQKLLPRSRVLALLRILKDFFLLERGEFAVALISAADERLTSRLYRSIDRPYQQGLEGLDRVVVKEGEVSAILARTWTTLSSLQGADDDDDVESLDLARDLLRLSIDNAPDRRDANHMDSTSKATSSNPELSNPRFDAFLLPTPTILSLDIPSPLHLVLSSSNVEIYSQIHAFLLAIRRGHLRLSQLFLLSVLRRAHPSPVAPNHLNHHDRMETLARMRQRADTRSLKMRPIWAAIASTTFLLAELSEYLHGQVIRSSWKEFYAWLDPSSSLAPPSANDTHDIHPFSPDMASKPESEPSPNSNPHHDPETLSLAHGAYLCALTQRLLLRHIPFTCALHSLLKSIDHLCGLMQNMATVQKALDLESDHGVINAFTNHASEEGKLLQELRAAGRELQAQIRGLVKVLREVDRGKTGAVIADIITDSDANAVNDVAGMVNAEGAFTPWKGWGVERLLLKLDWAVGEEDGN